MDFSDKREVKILVKECAAGNPNYQKMLYKALYSKMMGVCFRYGKNSENAKDLLQDGFIKVFEKIEKFNFKGSLEGWVRRIIVNNAIDSFRKAKKVYAVEDDVLERELIHFEEEQENIFENISAKEILNYVQQLSPAYQLVFNMYVLDEYSHNEIATRLGISVGTSKSNLNKAKKNLRTMILQKIKNEQIKQTRATH